MGNMIKVTAGSTTSYFSKIVSDSTVIADFMKENNINAVGATVQLNGEPLYDYDSTFAEAGIVDDCTLFSVVNAKNA